MKQNNGTQKAQKWGEYNCDIPIWTFEALLNQMREIMPDPDWFFFSF